MIVLVYVFAAFFTGSIAVKLYRWYRKRKD